MAKANEKETVVLQIRTTRKQGFRRAGLAITQKGIEVPKDSLSEKQIQQLEDEPLIMVSEAIRVTPE